MDLPTRWITSYLAVYEHGHYGRAAGALHLSTSAVSKHVSALERALSVTLLTRGSGASVEPTAAGERFAVAAAGLLDAQLAAAAAARSAPAQRTVRLGVLAGLPFTHAQSDYVRASVALACPGWSAAMRMVPFDRMTDCLVDEDVDVLWTGEAPLHPQLASVQIGVLPRIGLVARGALDGRTSFDAAAFADLPLLYNPRLPAEWMRPVCMDDVRPLKHARLVPSAATDLGRVIDHVARGDAVAVSGPPPPAALRQRVTCVRLDGLAPMRIHAAFRRRDRRTVVPALVSALRGARVAHQLGDLVVPHQQ